MLYLQFMCLYAYTHECLVAMVLILICFQFTQYISGMNSHRHDKVACTELNFASKFMKTTDLSSKNIPLNAEDL